MILKVLLVIGVITAIYFFFIKKKPSKVQGEQKNSKKQTPKANDMIECESCGVYCEVNDMILSGGKYYCSKECIEKG